MAGEATPPPGAASSGGDPSMEDILASIRRILNEDEPAAAPAAEPPAAPEPLTLTEDMLVTEETAPEGANVEAPPEPAAIVAPMPVPLPLPPAPPPPPTPPPPAIMALPAEALLAPAVAAAASASIGSLVRAVSQDRGASVTRGGPSIEDVVREELRPLLKAWLDQHLPEMVERLVRAEIERVVRRGLG